MTLCFIADFRSSIARSWIGYFAARHRVHVISTAAAAPMEGVELECLSRAAGPADRKRRWAWLLDGGHARWLPAFRDRWWLPARAVWLSAAIRPRLARIAPDLVHSLRIPVEAEAAGLAISGLPHLVSAWGNDFTLFASQSPAHAWLTRRLLSRTSGFLADAAADIERARQYGLAPEVPTLVVPGAGGVNTTVFRPPDGPPVWSGDLAPLAGLPAGTRLVLNARGFRAYVRNDAFFRACAQVAQREPALFVVGAGLKGWPPAESLVRRLGLERRVLLTGPLTQTQLAALHGQAALMVSPTEHDGTPNTLLEAMACGALPVCGDLPSIREWIDDGVNGILTPVGTPEPLAAAMLRALADPALAARARAAGPAIIARRAAYGPSMARADEFYQRVWEASRRPSAIPAELLPNPEIRS